MLERHSQTYTSAGLISLLEARLHDYIKPAVSSANVQQPQGGAQDPGTQQSWRWKKE